MEQYHTALHREHFLDAALSQTLHFLLEDDDADDVVVAAWAADEDVADDDMLIFLLHVVEGIKSVLFLVYQALTTIDPTRLNKE